MESKNTKYIEAVGRRKTSVARVRLSKSTKESVEVNGKHFDKYFTLKDTQLNALKALKGIEEKYAITARVTGGGIISQSEAMSHGISRALIKLNPLLRKSLKKEGYLKRDPRVKERRKFGLKKARKGPKWSKR